MKTICSKSLLLKFFNLLTIIGFIKNGIVEGIMGGHFAHGALFKYHVVLYTNDVYYCGGSILDNWHVITAAHCILKDNRNRFINAKYRIVSGITSLRDKSSRRNEVNVEKIYIPYNFYDPSPSSSASVIQNDVAVLKVEKSFKLNDADSPLTKVKLPPVFGTRNKSYLNEKATVTGFGTEYIKTRLDQSGKKRTEDISSHTLKFAETQVMTNEYCATSFERPIAENLICAQTKQHSTSNPEGVCYGDSGGPLVLDDKTLIGVLSLSPSDCNESDSAAVYIRVTSFVPFITSVMNGIITPQIRVAEYVKIKTGVFTSEKVLKETTAKYMNV